MTQTTFASYVTDAVRSDLVGHAYKMLGDRRDAEDATQRALVKAWAHWPQSDNALYLRRWLWQVLKHECIDEYRRTFTSWRKRIHGTLSLLYDGGWMVDPSPTPEETVIQAEEMEIRIAMLARLNPVQREALILCADTENQREVAAFLGIRREAVKSRAMRGRDELRRMMAVRR